MIDVGPVQNGYPHSEHDLTTNQHTPKLVNQHMDNQASMGGLTNDFCDPYYKANESKGCAPTLLGI